MRARGPTAHLRSRGEDLSDLWLYECFAVSLPVILGFVSELLM